MYGLNLLILVARRHFVRVLQGFLRFHRHLVKSQHALPLFSAPPQAKRGCRTGQPLSHITAFLLAYFAPAALATVGVPTFTLICFGFASSRFGIVRVSTPF